MKNHACHRFQRALSRRELLQTSASGFGMLALAGLLITGFGLKHEMAFGWDGWFISKALIWLFLGAAPSLALRRKSLARPITVAALVLGGLAIILVTLKPF